MLLQHHSQYLRVRADARAINGAVHAFVKGHAETLQQQEVTKMVALLVLMTILVFMTVD